MLTITAALSVEHRVLARLMDQILQTLSPGSSLGELRLIARLLEGCLRCHAGSEEELAFAALDHMLKHKGRLDQLYEDHEEINVHLRQIRQAKDSRQALRRLRRALRTVRKHFEWEESTVFPLIESTLQADTLNQLGATMLQQGGTRFPRPARPTAIRG